MKIGLQIFKLSKVLREWTCKVPYICDFATLRLCVRRTKGDGTFVLRIPTRQRYRPLLSLERCMVVGAQVTGKPPNHTLDHLCDEARGNAGIPPLQTRQPTLASRCKGGIPVELWCADVLVHIHTLHGSKTQAQGVAVLEKRPG